MVIPGKPSSITLGIAVALLLLAGYLVFQGLRILDRPSSIAAESFAPRVPLEGPYTPHELQLATSQLAQFTPDKVIPTTQDLHALTESHRNMERARQAVWQRHQQHRIQHALNRRPVGFALVALGSALLILWAFAGYRLWTAR